MVCMWDIQRNILPFLTGWKQLISKDLAVLITLLRRSITFFPPPTLRVTFVSLKYPERRSGGSSVKREDATFNNCLSNNFHCHLFPCQEKETIHIQKKQHC